MGVEVMNAFAENISEYAVVEKAPEIMGRNIFMILAPKSDKK
jgi:translation initiation factor IF-3